jgi:hypothetical protein
MKTHAEEFVRAMYAERAAWFAVANKPPGAPGHDPMLWQRWVAAVQSLISVSQPPQPAKVD